MFLMQKEPLFCIKRGSFLKPLLLCFHDNTKWFHIKLGRQIWFLWEGFAPLMMGLSFNTTETPMMAFFYK